MKFLGFVIVLLLVFSMTFLPALKNGYQIEDALSLALDGLIISIIGAVVVVVWICVVCSLNGFYIWSEEKRKKKYRL